jgi:hypothetical protein
MKHNSGNYIARVFWILVWIAFSSSDIYLFRECLVNKIQLTASVVIFVLFCLVSIIWLWIYFKLCWSDPGSTHKYFNEHDLSNNDQIQNLPRCKYCELPKPVRTYHCYYSDECFFRYDHYCFIFGNSIALYNIKAFVLIPIYSSFLFILFGVQYIFFIDWKFGSTIAGIIGGILIFLLAIAGIFLTFYFCCSFGIFNNQTTHERNIALNISYSHGCWNDFKEIFGDWCFFSSN